MKVDKMVLTCSTHRHMRMYIVSQSANPKGRDHLRDINVDGMIILKRILRKQGRKLWTGCIWLRTGTNGGLLWTR